MSQFRKQTFNSNPDAFKFLTACCLLLPEVLDNSECCEIIKKQKTKTHKSKTWNRIYLSSFPSQYPSGWMDQLSGSSLGQTAALLF